MHGFALLFSMGSTHQRRSIFEEGMLAHQPIDGGLSVGIQIFSEVSSFLYGTAFSPSRGRAQGLDCWAFSFEVAIVGHPDPRALFL